MKTIDDTMGVVLAGGKSTRMGEDKAFLKLSDIPLWLRAFNTLTSLVQDVVISHNESGLFPAGFQIIPDSIKDKGPLGGIYSVIKSRDSEFFLFLPVDLPLMNPDVLNVIMKQDPVFDVVYPCIQDRSHPLLARYKKTCLSRLETNLMQDNLKVVSFFESLHTKVLTEADFFESDPKLSSFFNMNTQTDLRLAQQIDQ